MVVMQNIREKYSVGVYIHDFFKGSLLLDQNCLYSFLYVI